MFESGGIGGGPRVELYLRGRAAQNPRWNRLTDSTAGTHVEISPGRQLSAPTAHMHDQADHKGDEENIEEHLRDAGECSRRHTEAQDRQNDRNHQEHQRPIEHAYTSSVSTS